MIQSLPLSLRDIASAIGEKKTLELVEAIGGQRIWIPLKPSLDWALFKTLGREAGYKLAALCGGSTIDVPICHKLKLEERNELIRADRANSMSVPELVVKYGLTRQHILQICKAKTSS